MGNQSSNTLGWISLITINIVEATRREKKEFEDEMLNARDIKDLTTKYVSSGFSSNGYNKNLAEMEVVVACWYISLIYEGQN